MKKIVSFITALLILLTFASCAVKPGEGSAAPADTAVTAADTGAATTGNGTEAPDTGDAGGEATEPEQTTETAVEATEPEQTEPEQTGDPGEKPSPLSDFSCFDLILAQYAERTAKKNYMISPLSFKYALGMLMAGADGETLKQFTEGLGIRDLSVFEDYIKDFNRFEEGFNATLERDKKEYDERIAEGADPDFLIKPEGALRVADSVWKRDDLPPFAEEYRMRLEMYNAEHRDFKPDNIVGQANKWVNEKTEGMIPKILPENYDTDHLAVMLMNALYYKNGWRYEFRKCGKADFKTADGAVVEKNYIVSEDRYRYYKDGETELVCVGMNNNIEMVFVIGDESDLYSKIRKAEKTNVKVIIPEFEIETSFDDGELCDFLRSLGVTDAFSPGKADFGKMIDGKKDLYVSDIIQKTKIKLDVTGVEAAAVTAIIEKDTAAPETSVTFKADVPFRFYIMTGESDWAATSGVTLFEGRLAE